MVPDTLKSVSFIEKDTKRFPDTSGWAYAQFLYDTASDTFAPMGNDAKCGYACHTTVAAKDYIFTAIMITEIVLWKMPDDMSRKEILNKFRATVPAWQGNPNLVHKAFLFDENSRRGVGVYLWKNIEAAKQAHGPAFQDRIKSVFGASPEFQYFDAPIVLDNTAKQVIDSAA